MENVETEDVRKYCVYLITNLVNGKQYAGKTFLPFKRRFGQHKSEARRGSGRYLCRAIRKHGEDSFVVSIIRERLTLREANEEEKLVIRTLKLDEDEFGYNLTAGGDGVIPNADTVKKMKANSGMRRWDLPEEEMIQLYESGVSASKIAEKIGCGATVVRRHLSWSGVDLRNRKQWRQMLTPQQRSDQSHKRRDVDNKEIVSLYQSGWLLEEIATKVGMSLTSIHRRMKSAGVDRRPRGKPKGWDRESKIRPGSGANILSIRSEIEKVRKPVHGVLPSSL